MVGRKYNKLRLAYVSPLPPEESGISFYSEELLPYLSRYYHITLVVDQKEVSSELKNNFEVMNYQEFLYRFKKFDRMICHFGNSFYHKHMLYLIEEFPCVTVLHDVFLTDLINWVHSTGYYSNLLLEEAYYSHGWSALLDMKKNFEEFLNKYPLNSRIINNSIGVILHNKYALDSIKKFYSSINEEKFEIIPLIKKAENSIKNNKIEEVLICSFGYVTPLKKPETIIEGFALSKVSKLRNARLVFVGKPLNTQYGSELTNLAKKLNIEDKVDITGFIDKKIYKEYLQKALISIQLRINSKGETSKAVLDVLAHGKPLVINAHGSLNEFPKDVVYFVSEYVKPQEIANAIDDLYNNDILRKKLSKNAIEYIRRFHDPGKVAKRFYEAIEKFYKQTTLPEFLDKIASVIKHEKDIGKYSSLISRNFSPLVRNKRIFVDVSVICLNDIGTGIQRVVKAQLNGLIENPPEGYRIEPIRLTNEDGRWVFKYARKYTKNLLNIPDNEVFSDTRVDFREGDIYYSPDYFCPGIIEGFKAGVFNELLLKGVKIAFLVYDMLPIELPHYFPIGTPEMHANWARTILKISDLLLCISNTTANSLKSFAKKENLYRKDLKIKSLYLGSEINKAKHKNGLTAEDIFIFDKIKENPYFLMVSTIEPRKGHFQTIKAFELLWKKDYKLNLVLVGKEGWMVKELISYIKKHPRLNKNLFWLGYVSDDLLKKLYKNALATIVASEGEGFGLSLIESAYYRTPIIARDIPVFREIAGKGAYYFNDSKDPEDLAKAIEEWLKLYKKGKYPKPEDVKWISWEEHIEKLKEILLEDSNS